MNRKYFSKKISKKKVYFHSSSLHVVTSFTRFYRGH